MKKLVFVISLLWTIAAQADTRTVIANHNYENIRVDQIIDLHNEVVPSAQLLIEKPDGDENVPYLWFAVKRGDGIWDTWDIGDVRSVKQISSANKNIIKFKMRFGRKTTTYSIDISKVLINDTVQMESNP